MIRLFGVLTKSYVSENQQGFITLFAWFISHHFSLRTNQQSASSTFLSEQTSHGLSATSQQYFSLRTNQQSAISTFLSEQTSHQPPAKRTGCMS
jgi:hypothetical protein